MQPPIPDPDCVYRAVLPSPVAPRIKDRDIWSNVQPERGDRRLLNDTLERSLGSRWLSVQTVTLSDEANGAGHANIVRASSPFAVGLMSQLLGNYDASFMMLAAFWAIGSMSVLVASRPRVPVAQSNPPG